MKEEKLSAAVQAELLGTRILEASRDELYLEMRFLDMSFSALQYQKFLSTFLAGTDGQWIYYHPGFLIGRYQEHPVLVNRLYLHMIFHCVFRHLWMREERKEDYWNLACDIAVEAVIDRLNSEATLRLISDKREEWYARLSKKMKVLTAEGIYHFLWNFPMGEEQFLELEKEFLVDDHAFWTAKKREKETESSTSSKKTDSGQDEETDVSSESMDLGQIREKTQEFGEGTGQAKARWQRIGESMKTNLETFARQAGKDAGTLSSYLRVEYRNRQQYSEFLKRFAVWREELHVDEDSFDLNFYTFGLSQYGNLPLIEPLEYREEKKIEEFVIIIDTSGSCPEDAVERFLSETYSILKNRESFFQKMKIHLIQCDAAIQSDTVITSQEELNQWMKQVLIRGSGGTDFRPAFSYVEHLKEEGGLKNLKGLLYFTDGYGSFPEKRPSFETAFLFYREDATEVKAPPWAEKLFLNADSFDKKLTETRPERIGRI